MSCVKVYMCPVLWLMGKAPQWAAERDQFWLAGVGEGRRIAAQCPWYYGRRCWGRKWDRSAVPCCAPDGLTTAMCTTPATDCMLFSYVRLFDTRIINSIKFQPVHIHIFFDLSVSRKFSFLIFWRIGPDKQLLSSISVT